MDDSNGFAVRLIADMKTADFRSLFFYKRPKKLLLISSLACKKQRYSFIYTLLAFYLLQINIVIYYC